MKIHLKRNEKLFLNGAVIRMDRRGSIELMNDAQFLLENHIMQQEEANTPLRQIYFIVQTMLMDPANAHLTVILFRSFAERLKEIVSEQKIRENIADAEALVEKLDYYAALKILRTTFRNGKNEKLSGTNEGRELASEAA